MEQIVVALDTGSSRLKALAARKNLGKLSVLHAESLPSEKAIRRGRVYNLDETSDLISKLIRNLNAHLPSPVEKIYAGIGGQSLRTIPFSVKRSVESGSAVGQQLLESMKEEAKTYKPEWDDNLEVVSEEYFVDGQLTFNPKGALASGVEARFLLAVGNPCLKGHLQKVFSKIDISVEYFISPIATAEAVLTPEEKELGCALLEFGEEVTYVSVYKNRALRFIITLPLGGLAITKDIRSLNVSEEEAEALKIKHGRVGSESTDNGEVSVNEEQNSSRKIELKNLNLVVKARADEIIKNVWNQIQLSGYSQTLDAGIVITGGGALLRDLPAYIRNFTGKEVRLAGAKTGIDRTETQLSPADSCVVGLAILGKETSLKAPEKIVQQDIFGETEVRVQEKKRKKDPAPQTNTNTPLNKLKSIFTRGIIDMVDKGQATLFKDEDYDNTDTQPVEGKNNNTKK